MPACTSRHLQLAASQAASRRSVEAVAAAACCSRLDTAGDSLCGAPQTAACCSTAVGTVEVLAVPLEPAFTTSSQPGKAASAAPHRLCTATHVCLHSPADAAAPADAPLPDSGVGARPARLCTTDDISSCHIKLHSADELVMRSWNHSEICIASARRECASMFRQLQLAHRRPKSSA